MKPYTKKYELDKETTVINTSCNKLSLYFDKNYKVQANGMSFWPSCQFNIKFVDVALDEKTNTDSKLVYFESTINQSINYLLMLSVSKIIIAIKTTITTMKTVSGMLTLVVRVKIAAQMTMVMKQKIMMIRTIMIRVFGWLKKEEIQILFLKCDISKILMITKMLIVFIYSIFMVCNIANRYQIKFLSCRCIRYNIMINVANIWAVLFSSKLFFQISAKVSG